MSTSTLTKVLWAIDKRTVLAFTVAAALGVLVAASPLVGLAALPACFVVYGIYRWCRTRLEVWQVLVLFAMTPYFLMNYGFDNFAVGWGGMQFPVGDLLIFLAIVLLMWGKQSGLLSVAMQDSAVICMSALLLLSIAHLIFDVPRFGMYALRDSSMIFEAALLVLGMVWASDAKRMQLLMRWLFFVFFINLFYSYTFPWGEAIRTSSPSAGVFHPVPLFGNYQQSAMWLLLGALFFVWLGPSLVRWPRWVLLLLAAAQLGGLAILQVRSMYVGIAVIFLILFLLGELRKAFSLASMLAWGTGVLIVFLLFVSMAGIQIQGRMGPVDFSFIANQTKTLVDLVDPNTRMSHDVDRSGWYQEVWGRIQSSASNTIIGEGFGQALINFETEEGIPVRQPHNSSLTVLARLGFVGLAAWLLFILLVCTRYVRYIRNANASAQTSSLMVWLLCAFVVALLQASVQPSLEFSSGACPFYFLAGIGLGIIRWRKREPYAVSLPMSSRQLATPSA
jgi:O-antigen ligase